MNQDATNQAMQRAVQLHRAGNFAEAEKIYRQVLSEQPKNPGVLNLLGVLAYQVGRPELAIELIRQAIAIHPQAADFHLNLGNVLYAKGLLAEAAAENRQAIRLHPRYAQAHNNLGNCLHDMGLLDEAIASYRHALVIEPGLPETFDNLGTALRDRGLPADAAVAHRQSLALRPDSAKCHHHLGNALRDQNLMDEAVAAYDQAVRLDPENATLHNDRGIALRERGSLEDALGSFQRALALHSDYSDAHNNLAIVLRDQGRIDEALAACREAVRWNPASDVFHSNLILFMHYHPDAEPRALLAESCNWAAIFAEPLKPEIRPHANDRSADRRLKIGYVSGDFRVHPIARFIAPLLAAHDPTQVEIYCYAQVARADATTERLKSLAHQWRVTVGMSDAQLAEQIRRDGIDILIDLSAHTGSSRLKVFARKPAPVQATYLAYAGSTGLSAMDYRITDPYLDPPGTTDDCYCEPPIEDLPPSPLPVDSAGFITFGCMNNFCKVSDPAMKTWCAVLAAVPNSRFRLHSYPGSHCARIRRMLADAGVDPQRLSFVGKLPLRQYMEEFQHIDIGLDPFPFPGGTTTCDAMWMGVPVITLSGSTAVSRGGVSLLTSAGLPELIAANTDDYVRLAADLAADAPRLRALRGGLRQRMGGSVLMDAGRFARQMEAAYRRMWRTWCEAAKWSSRNVPKCP
jgi:protein O-GlcNAc transferase